MNIIVRSIFVFAVAAVVCLGNAWGQSSGGNTQGSSRSTTKTGTGTLTLTSSTMLHSGMNKVAMSDGSYLMVELEDVLVSSVRVVSPTGASTPLERSTESMGDCQNGQSCWADKGNNYLTCICIGAVPANGGTAPVDSASSRLTLGGKSTRGGTAPLDSAGTTLTIGTKNNTAAVAIPAFMQMRKRAR